MGFLGQVFEPVAMDKNDQKLADNLKLVKSTWETNWRSIADHAS